MNNKTYCHVRCNGGIYVNRQEPIADGKGRRKRPGNGRDDAELAAKGKWFASRTREQRIPPEKRQAAVKKALKSGSAQSHGQSRALRNSTTRHQG